MTGQFVPIKLNAEKDGAAVAKKYKVTGFPTILFINGAGEVEGKIGGYMPPEGFSQQLTTIAKAHREFPALGAKMKANPGNSAVAAELAGIYAGRGNIAKAETMLEIAEKGDPRSGNGALARAYNAIADYYQEKGQFDRAIPIFTKAIKAGQSSNDIAYARISIASCCFSKNKPKEAIPSLEAILKMKDAPQEYLDQAKQMLDAAKRGGGQ